MMTKAVKDAQGRVINIGPWDYQTAVDNVNGRLVEVIGNPLPSGAYEADISVFTGYDGGIYEEGDPRGQGLVTST